MKKDMIESDKNYIYWGFTIFTVIAAAILLFFMVYRFSAILVGISIILKILTPIIYGLLLAYIMTPVLNILERKYFVDFSKKFFKKYAVDDLKVARILSIITTSIIYILILVGFIGFVIPALFGSIQGIVANIPGYLNDGRDWIANLFSDNPEINEMIVDNYQEITIAVTNFINNSLAPSMDNVVATISSGLIDIIKFFLNLIIGFITSIYVLYGKENFCAQAKKMLYSTVSLDKAKVVLDNVRYVHKIFSGFLFGKIIDSLIVGLICFVGMVILKIPYAPLVAVIVCVTNVIPYFGPFIGAIPSAILIFLVSPSKCLVFGIFILILQQFDGNILGPKILSGKTGLSSFWILFSILIFGGLFGFAGMIFGVPLFAVIYAFIQGLCKNRLEKSKLFIETKEYEKIDYYDPVSGKPIYFK